jgi:outer membrane protein with glycine zipper
MWRTFMHGMLNKTIRWSTACLIALAACRDGGNQAKVDSDLARDIALAARSTTQPQFEDTALAPAPIKAAPKPSTEPRKTPTRTASRPQPRVETRQPAPAPVEQQTVEAPAPAPRPAAVVAQIGTGTQISLSSSARVCTQTNRPGDKFIATVTTATTGTNGAEIPAGSRVVMEVASVTPGDSPEAAQLGFRVRSIVINDADYKAAGDVQPVTPLERTKIANADPNADKKKVVGGAIAGALLGQILGKNTKSTVIGAAAGAAAGAAVAKAKERYEACLPDGGELRLTLSEPMVMASRE